MARNEEKAQSMLYRFRKAMQAEDDEWRGTRTAGHAPYTRALTEGDLALDPASRQTHVSISKALAIRRALTADISKKVGQITTDEALTDEAVRALNDDLNRLVVRKRAWDARLLSMGYGAKYARGGAPRSRDDDEESDDGALPPHADGEYIYFGRARLLRRDGAPPSDGHAAPIAEGQGDGTAAHQRAAARARRIAACADDAYFGSLAGEPAQLLLDEAAEDARAQEGAPRTSAAHWQSGLPTAVLPRVPAAPIVPLRPPVPTQAQVEAHLIATRRTALLAAYAADDVTVQK